VKCPKIVSNFLGAMYYDTASFFIFNGGADDSGRYYNLSGTGDISHLPYLGHFCIVQSNTTLKTKQYENSNIKKQN
jgi:hypothetical protein